MIKAVELRLGNFLIYKGEVVYVTTLTLDVDDEREQTIGFCKLGQATDEVMGWERALDLQGIAITPEWLERYAFASMTHGSGISWHHPGLCFGLYKESLFYLVEDEYEYFGNIKYVHQVQNIFHALTGTELEIKLP